MAADFIWIAYPRSKKMLWIVFGAFCHCPASKSTAVDFLHSSLSMGPCKIPADRFSKQTVQGECAPRSLKAGHHAPFCLRNAAPFSANTVHHSQRHAIHRSFAAVAASSGNRGKYPFGKIVFAFSVSHCFISSCCMAANAHRPLLRPVVNKPPIAGHKILFSWFRERALRF